MGYREGERQRETKSFIRQCSITGGRKRLGMLGGVE
jgi:hypothetical protein